MREKLYYCLIGQSLEKMELITDKTTEIDIDINAQCVKEGADRARTHVDEGQRQMGDMLGTTDSIHRDMQEIGQLAHQTVSALEKTGEIIGKASMSIDQGTRTAHDIAEFFRNVNQATNDFMEISDNLNQITLHQKKAIQTALQEVQTALDITDTN